MLLGLRIGANTIFHVEWALPVQSSFRFNEDQKIFLFKVFEAGEKTGNKSKPEENQLMQNLFTPKDYCFTKQI